jgi:hypothetical protein
VSLVPQVSVVVELKVSVDVGDPVVMERAIAAEGRRGARELYQQALKVLDEQATASSGAARQRLEARWMATTVGRVRLWRYRVRGAQGSFHPLDRLMGLSQAEPSPALREAVCDIAVRVPYRQVAHLVSRLAGEAISHQSSWRILRAEGARIRGEEDELLRSVFELGEAPPEEGPAPELVVAEADGTYLAAQREPLRKFEVKSGVLYTGKRPVGGRRHRRWRLVDKGCYATTADADGFGMGLAARGFDWLGLHRALYVLAAHDGLDEFGATFRGWFPGAIHQVDHFHVAERCWDASGGDPARFRALREMAFTDPAALAQAIRSGAVAVSGYRAPDLPGYLDGVAPDLYGVDRLPRRLRRGRMRVVGTGVVEKHQDLLVNRRMKRQGMRWTRKGAEALLALQGLRFCGRWPATWGVIDR